MFKVIVQTFALKKWWFYENFVPGPQNLRGVSFFKVFMIFPGEKILNHLGNQFWEFRNRNFENQLIWNFCSGNTVKIELRMFFFAETLKYWCIALLFSFLVHQRHFQRESLEQKFLFRKNHHFLHTNCFHTSLKI